MMCVNLLEHWVFPELVTGHEAELIHGQEVGDGATCISSTSVDAGTVVECLCEVTFTALVPTVRLPRTLDGAKANELVDSLGEVGVGAGEIAIPVVAVAEVVLVGVPHHLPGEDTIADTKVVDEISVGLAQLDDAHLCGVALQVLELLAELVVGTLEVLTQILLLSDDSLHRAVEICEILAKITDGFPVGLGILLKLVDLGLEGGVEAAGAEDDCDENDDALREGVVFSHCSFSLVCVLESYFS